MLACAAERRISFHWSISSGVSGCCSRTAAPVVLLGLATYTSSPRRAVRQRKAVDSHPGAARADRPPVAGAVRRPPCSARSCRSSRRRRRAGRCDRPRAGRCVRRFARRQPPRGSSEPGSGASSASTGTSVPTALNSSWGAQPGAEVVEHLLGTVELAPGEPVGPGVDAVPDAAQLGGRLVGGDRRPAPAPAYGRACR